MKKLSKKSLVIFFIYILLVNLIPNNVYAVASASMSVESNTIYVGESTQISINIVNTETWEFTLTASGGELSNSKDGDAYGKEETKTAMTTTFTASKPGKYTISFMGTIAGSDLTNLVDASGSVEIEVKEKEQEDPVEEPNTDDNTETPNTDNNEQNTPPSQVEYPTETKPQENEEQETPKSSNNYLSSLSIGTGTLSPEFYRETYEYTVEFGEDINLYELTSLELSAQAEDSRAKVSGAGTIELVEGENTININVTAENGSVRTYTVKVVKPAKVEQSALRLAGVVINGVKENGEFQSIEFSLEPETFEYNLTVPNTIKSLSINPTTENEDIIIEVTGAESLKEGQNTILIILTSPSDETIKTTYTLNVERQAAPMQENNTEDKNQTKIIIIGGTIGGVLLLIIIIAIVKHAKKKKRLEASDEDDYEIEDENQESDVNYPNYNKDNEEDDDEENYPFRGISKNKDLLEKENKNEKIEEQTMPTTDDIENPKLKWDDFVNNDEENEEESNNIKRKNKRGKRFL